MNETSWERVAHSAGGDYLICIIGCYDYYVTNFFLHMSCNWSASVGDEVGSVLKWK